MRRISFEYNAERSPEKNKFEAKQIMKDIKQIHEEFNKIIAPKDLEIQGNKAKALLEKKDILHGIEKDKIGKNIGHQKFSKDDKSKAKKFGLLPNCFRTKARSKKRFDQKNIVSKFKTIHDALDISRQTSINVNSLINDIRKWKSQKEGLMFSGDSLKEGNELKSALKMPIVGRTPKNKMPSQKQLNFDFSSKTTNKILNRKKQEVKDSGWTPKIRSTNKVKARLMKRSSVSFHQL